MFHNTIAAACQPGLVASPSNLQEIRLEGSLEVKVGASGMTASSQILSLTE